MTTSALRPNLDDRVTQERVSLPPEVSNETISVMTGHESIRSFNPGSISEEALAAILISARSAPTSSNLQSYSIIVVRDPERKARLSAMVGNQRCVIDAPIFLVFCADISRLKYVAQRQQRHFAATNLEMFLTSSLDAALAMQNALVAAESLGLGAVPIGSVRNDAIAMAAELGLPDGAFAVVGLCIGYEKAGTRRGTKPRLPHQVTVHEEQYSSDGLDDHLVDYDKLMMARRTYAGRRVSMAGEPETEGADYGWMEHSARRCSTPDTIRGAAASLRENLREQVEQRGFVVR